jgi:acetyl esterase
MALHQEAVRYLETVKDLPPVAEVGATVARERRRRQVRETPDLVVPVDRVEDVAMGGPAGPVALRIYQPGTPTPRPVLVYLHGGGWVVGDLDQVDVACRLMCQATGATVVSVDYHLAPEHPFPTPAEEAYHALMWAADNGHRWGGDPRRLAVAGDSSGGNLALAAALMARDRGGPALAAMALVYPVSDRRFDTASYREFAAGYGLTRADMMWYWAQYVPDAEGDVHPYAAPLRAESLTGLPPAVLVTAEYDVLRSEGEALGDRLAEAGVSVRRRRFEGLIHGFFTAPWAGRHRQAGIGWVARELTSLWMAVGR